MKKWLLSAFSTGLMSLVIAWESVIAGYQQTISLSKVAAVIRTRHGQAAEELVQDHRTVCICVKTTGLFVVGDLISRSREL